MNGLPRPTPTPWEWVCALCRLAVLLVAFTTWCVVGYRYALTDHPLSGLWWAVTVCAVAPLFADMCGDGGAGGDEA